VKIRPKRLILYRAVSDAELIDIKSHGLRTKPGGYETVKLFALNYDDANSFGRLNQLYDGLPFFIVKVAVTHKVFDESFRFEADGMDTISIEEKYLNLLNVTF
jgi:hypothetical protein